MDAALGVSFDGRIGLANRSAAEMFGFESGDALVGLDIREIGSALLGEAWPVVAVALQEKRSVALFEAGVLRAGQGDRHLSVQVSPIADGEHLFGASVLIRDVTSEKELEEELAIHRRELERTNVELERSNRDLERFAYAASHDLQEPLRMVHSYVELLARRYEGQLDEEADEFIGFALDGAVRMRSMINNLLELSRVMRRPLEKAEIELAELVKDVLNDLKGAVEESGTTVTVGSLPRVVVDPNLMRGVLQNLLLNAIRFGKTDPKIELSAWEAEDEWVVSVEDDGTPIPVEAREKVFEPFTRLKRQEHSRGSGLGLAQVRTIVERHGGRVWADDARAGGTAIRFTIPTDHLSNRVRERHEG